MARSDHPHVIAPPPLIAAAAVAIGLVLDWLLPLDVLRALFSGVLRIVIGLVLVGAGGALALIAERAFHAGGTNVMPWKPSIVLVTTGVFSRLRNPMYVGLGLIVVGIAVALASDWTLIALGPAAIVLHRGVVLREERYLEGKFGDAYRRYKTRVPRYGWPR
ncbi:MAG TPA: isoprenylcysteine carboxylmethyltransferase family protein [Xanthobacteraceae bacterium]